MPFASYIIDKIGHIHLIYSAILIEAGRLVLFSLIKQSPPIYAYGLAI